jgi:hypothetical protein
MMNHQLGFVVTLLSVSATVLPVGVGVAHAQVSYVPLVGLVGVLAGASLIIAGVKSNATAAAGNPSVFSLPAAGAIASSYLRRRRDLSVVGLLTRRLQLRRTSPASAAAGRPSPSSSS